jgi:hypothetical protein
MSNPYDPRQQPPGQVHNPPPQQFDPNQPYVQPGPYSGPPAGFYPPQPPPKKRSKAWVWILSGFGVLIGLCLFGAAVQNLAGNGTNSASSDSGDGTAPAKPGAKAKPVPKAKALPGFGQAVRDGKFEFVVSGMDCSKATLGNEFLNTKAQGKFCVVDVSVKNIGDVPQTFSGSTQKAFDIKGAEFTNDSGAEFYANDNNETFINDINPGNKVNGKVVFDVSKQTTLTTVELHDSVFSGGVKVALK